MTNYITSYHSIEEFIKKGGAKTLYTCKSNKRIDLISNLARKKKVKIEKVTAPEMDRLCGKDHKGAALVVEEKPQEDSNAVHYRDVKNFLRDKKDSDQLFVMILDGITDPHNFGAILRSADQFSVDLVIIPEKRSVDINSTVAKVSVGAHAWVPVMKVNNLSRTIEDLQADGFWVYGADMGGDTAERTDLKGRTAIVMGSEGDGISRLVREKCDTMVSIPMNGHVDSLNVSVAAGILMYEVLRQRG